MTDRPPSWDEFEHRPTREPGEAKAREDDFAALCARVLTTADGKDLLRHLRMETIERILPAARAPESALRALEAQRQMVHRLEALRDAGLEAAAKKSKS